MALKMPKADTGQPNSLLAQYDMRLLRRLAIWGGVAALSLAVAVIVSQTQFGSKRLQLAMSGPEQADPAMGPVIVQPAVPPLTDAAVDKLEAVARNTAATRAATKQLALQVNKLTADSFRFTGRLANLEHQIDGLTGSIKQQAEQAAAKAIAKAKLAQNSALDKVAPKVSAPATTLPKLSLIMPPQAAVQDVAYTSAIMTPEKPAAGVKMASPADARVEAKTAAKTETQTEAKTAQGAPAAAVDPKGLPKLKPKEAAPSTASILQAARAEALKVKAAEGKAKVDKHMAAKTMASKAMAAESEAASAHKLMKVASTAPVRRRHSNPRWAARSGYGIDLGSADSLNVVTAQWAAIKANFGPTLAGMHPTAVRQHRLLGGGSFRLVVGRLPSLKAAENLCARFTRQQVSCSPIQFDGERVIWR